MRAIAILHASRMKTINATRPPIRARAIDVIHIEMSIAQRDSKTWSA
jgi:hypothetical protein